MDSSRCYLLPFPLLRRAWRQNAEKWKQWGKENRNGYKVVSAQNQGYRTWSLAVPTERLFSALYQASLVVLREPVPAFPPPVADDPLFPYVDDNETSAAEQLGIGKANKLFDTAEFAEDADEDFHL